MNNNKNVDITIKGWDKLPYQNRKLTIALLQDGHYQLEEVTETYDLHSIVALQLHIKSNKEDFIVSLFTCIKSCDNMIEAKINDDAKEYINDILKTYGKVINDYDICLMTATNTDLDCSQCPYEIDDCERAYASDECKEV